MDDAFSASAMIASGDSTSSGRASTYSAPAVKYHGRVGEVTLSHTVVFGAGLARALAASVVGTTPTANGGNSPTNVVVPGGGNVPGAETQAVTHTVVNNAPTAPGSGSAPGSAAAPAAGAAGPTGGGSGGKLPFTGMSAVYLAGAGAAMASTGAAVRRYTRRHTQEP